MQGLKITHTVFKNKDLNKALNQEGKRMLALIEGSVGLYRSQNNKTTEPQYIVINTDEPYIDEIVEVLKRHGHWG